MASSVNDPGPAQEAEREDFWAEEEDDKNSIISSDTYPTETTAILEYTVSRYVKEDDVQRTYDKYRQKVIGFFEWSDGHLYDLNEFDPRYVYAEKSEPNDVLEKQPQMKTWRSGAASAQRSDLMDLLTLGRGHKVTAEDKLHLSIPLFNDARTGDEYRVYREPEPNFYPLAVVYCERHLNNSEENAGHFFYRLREGQNTDLAAVSTIPIPRLVFTLGCLEIGNRSQATDGSYRTFPTDYMVLVDVGSGDTMSVWIAANGKELEERLRRSRINPRIELLNIFDGEMANDKGGYHLACISPSLRSLASMEGSFSDACSLIRRTRANTDPDLFVLTKSEVERITSNPVPVELGGKAD